MAKTVKVIRNHSLKRAKAFSQQPIPQFIPMLPSILELSRLVRNLPSHKHVNENLIIQTNRPSNS